MQACKPGLDEHQAVYEQQALYEGAPCAMQAC